jgi:hypothetical protein
MTVHLSSAADNALTALLRTGPYKTYTFVKSVVEDLKEMGEKPINLLVADQPYPFTYDGTSLIENWTLSDYRFDRSNFKDRSSVGVEVTVMGYRMGDKEPGYSLSMKALYRLGPTQGLRWLQLSSFL